MQQWLGNLKYQAFCKVRCLWLGRWKVGIRSQNLILKPKPGHSNIVGLKLWDFHDYNELSMKWKEFLLQIDDLMCTVHSLQWQFTLKGSYDFFGEFSGLAKKTWPLGYPCTYASKTTKHFILRCCTIPLAQFCIILIFIPFMQNSSKQYSIMMITLQRRRRWQRISSSARSYTKAICNSHGNAGQKERDPVALLHSYQSNARNQRQKPLSTLPVLLNFHLPVS